MKDRREGGREERDLLPNHPAEIWQESLNRLWDIEVRMVCVHMGDGGRQDSSCFHWGWNTCYQSRQVMRLVSGVSLVVTSRTLH